MTLAYPDILSSLLAAATPFVLTLGVPALIYFVKTKVWPKVPTVLLPIAAPILGLLLDYGMGLFSAAPVGNLYLAAFFGALGVWLREVVDQLKKSVFV